ncbi:glycosyltransferase family 2 protein [Aliivibrio fischeri]|uniref:glycosyltransferase family 2 protein n=1 Tax=Aliivibrio fischeri TaxID=668 RepID=UPI0012DA0A08|nr:glycosyltransferase family 2 protein [Aliivibrio fischeri]MUL10722.1 glycosyltransferase [Aliivibrio fischeri]MUL13905.1 glycosyltransferase [Aliivibrio fischeri]
MINIIETVLIATSSITLLATITLLLAYKLKKDSNCKTELPLVSVFVPFFNEEPKLLLKSLEHIELQNYPSQLQILLIDDGSDNNTIEHVEKWLAHPKKQSYEVVRKPINEGRKGFALDYALELNIANGEAYIIVDSDTFIEPNGIKELVSKLWSNDKYAAVCGYITPNNYKDSFIGLLQHYEHISFYGAIRAAQDKLGCVPVLAGAFVAHRASVVKKLGGWSDWLVEDIAWCWKAISNNYKTGYAPKAKATTQCPTSAKALFKQRRRWARGRVEAYLEAWKTNWIAGLCATPWFVVTAIQYIVPSSIILFIFMVAFNIWIPIALGVVNIICYIILVRSYIKDFSLENELTLKQIFKAPVFSMILESLTWLPNLFGYIDELSGKKKTWLTR